MLQPRNNPILAATPEPREPLAARVNPILAPPPAPKVLGGVALAEREMMDRPHLAGDRRTVQEHKADVRDSRQAKSAREALGELPGTGEAVHVLISGRFSLWDTVPAILETVPGAVEWLHVATLGFSRRNVEGMAALLDAGRVKRLRLLASHYFKGTSPHIYQHCANVLGERAGAEFLSSRTHCKILLLRFESGRTFALESSANLRSCKNIEQLTIFGSPALWEFHRGWIDELFAGAKHVNCYAGGAEQPARPRPR